jgi:uncharacterized membrane protein
LGHADRLRAAARFVDLQRRCRYGLPCRGNCHRALRRDAHAEQQRRNGEMGKERLAAFSDGVIAILITIMVLELRIPHGADWPALASVVPSLLTYAMSFVYLAIYWNNHHHLLYTVARVDGLILWANSHLLFWLSLVPAATAWMGENLATPLPTAVYGAVLLMPSIAYYLLQAAIVHRHGRNSVLAEALGRDIKGKLSVLLYGAGVALAFVQAWASIAIYILVALMWLIPDRRIENAVGKE